MLGSPAQEHPPMQETTLIDQGLNLMLYGMGTVFVFLTVLVGATVLMSSLVNRIAPPAEQIPEGDHSQPSPQIRSAIAKAIALHRKN